MANASITYQATSLNLVDAAPHYGGNEVAGVSLPLQHSLQVDAEQLLFWESGVNFVYKGSERDRLPFLTVVKFL